MVNHLLISKARFAVRIEQLTPSETNMEEEKFCKECMLQFSNSAGYKKHQVKFCPYVDKNKFRDYGVKIQRANLESSVSSHVFIDKFRTFSLNDRHKNNGEDLQREERKLEIERENILKQLDLLTNSLSSSQISNDESRSKTRNNSKTSTTTNPNLNVSSDDDVRSSTKLSTALPPNIVQTRLSTKARTIVPPSITMSRKNYNEESSKTRENQLLKNIKDMYNDYINNGGVDEEVIQHFRNLQRDMLKFEEKTIHDVEKLVYNLQEQLQDYHNANVELKKEIGMLKKAEELSVNNKSRNTNVQTKCSSRQRFISQPVENNNIYATTETVYNKPFQGNYYEKRLMEMRQEAEMYRQQLEVEHLRYELNSLRGHPSKPILPLIGSQHVGSHHQQQMINHDVVNTQNDLYQKIQQKNDDAFQSAPYDPASGFSIFWDFVSAPDQHWDSCRLLVTLYKDEGAVSETKILPTIPFSPFSQNTVNRSNNISSNVAVLGVKQIFSQCFPMDGLSLCVCLQVGNKQNSNGCESFLTDCGWCKIDLFDSYNRVVSGRWKAPVRILPVKAGIDAAQLNTIPQLAQTEVFYRLVNSRNTEAEDGNVLVPQLITNYKYPPMDSYPVFALPQVAMGPSLISAKESNHSRKKTPKKSSKHSIKNASPIQVSVPIHNDPSFVTRPNSEIAKVFDPPPHPQEKQQQDQPSASKHKSVSPSCNSVRNNVETRPLSLPSLSRLTAENDVGVSIDRVMDLTIRPAKVVITIHNPDGKLGHTNTGKAQFISKYVGQTFLEMVHCFSLESYIFQSLQWYRWSILRIAIYEENNVEGADDTLLAWAVLPLYESNGNPSEFNLPTTRNSHYSITSPAGLPTELLKSGHINIQLYKPPMLESKKIIEKLKNSVQFGNFIGSSIVLFISNDNVPQIDAPLFIPTTQRLPNPPVNSWINHSRSAPHTLFANGKGFDLYIDEGHMFPDSTIAVKVIVGFWEGSAFSKKDPFKFRYESTFNLETNAFDPVFDMRVEFREFSFKPGSKFIFLVYILDDITKEFSLLGRNIIPVFVKPDTFQKADPLDSNFCLNSGNFQLKLYQNLEDRVNFGRDKLSNPVPCSSLLVRLVSAPCYDDGEPKRGREFPEDQWIQEGLLIPRPTYELGTYDSQECKPSDGDKEILHYLANREHMTVKERIKQIAPDGRKTRVDKGLVDYIENKFKSSQSAQNTFDITFFSKFNSMHGFYIWIKRAKNLKSNGFTFAHYCISPPGSFYTGNIEDPVSLITKFSMDSPQKHPEWIDPLKVFPRRKYNSNLALVVQLYESVPLANDFSFKPIGWTLFPLMQLSYLQQGEFQIPLFNDLPTQEMIVELQSKPIIPTITRLRKSKVLKMIEGSSIYFRVGDNRYIEDATKNDFVTNQTFLPRNSKFHQRIQSEPLKTCVPAGITPEDYNENMGNAFKRHISNVFKGKMGAS